MPCYQWKCLTCDHRWEVICPMAESEDAPPCPDCFGYSVMKPPVAPKVMRAALPDGTKRFDGIRRAIEQRKEAKVKKDEDTRKAFDRERQKSLPEAS